MSLNLRNRWSDRVAHRQECATPKDFDLGKWRVLMAPDSVRHVFAVVHTYLQSISTLSEIEVKSICLPACSSNPAQTVKQRLATFP